MKIDLKKSHRFLGRFWDAICGGECLVD